MNDRQVTPFTAEELDAMLNCDGIGGDEEFLDEIIEMAVDSSQQRIQDLDKALAEDNHEAIWRLAHAIKSTCLMAHMEAFGNAAVNVERAYRKPTGEDVSRRAEYIAELKFQGQRLILTYQNKQM